MTRTINDRSLLAYIGAAVTAGALMALPLPAHGDSHVHTAKNGVHAGLTFPSPPGGGGEVEEKPRKKVRKHVRIRKAPRKYVYYKRPVHKYVEVPQKIRHEKISVHGGHGGGGGHGGHHRHRHHRWHHGGHHNGRFVDDLILARHLRRHHSFHAAHEAVTQDARRWLGQRSKKVHHKPEKVPHGVKGKEAHEH